MMCWAGRCALRIFKNSQRATSSAPTLAVASDKLTEGSQKLDITSTNGGTEMSPQNADEKIQNSKSKLVAAAFASLKKNTLQKKSTGALDEKINNARSPEELLSLTENFILSRRQALKIVSVLAEWSVKNQDNMSDYESDPRFVALCQLLGRMGKRSKEKSDTKKISDLSMVLGVTGDDEAAKLISSISLDQMIKVLTSLAAKKRRSVSLLRSLAYNITNTSIKLDVKQGADIFYSLASLNFPDEVLLEKVSSDLCECLLKCQKTAVIGSIATSIGIMRYKDNDLLDILCEWVSTNKELCRNQDLAKLLYTLASVNHSSLSETFLQNVITTLEQDEFPDAATWLDVVWSLTVLGLAQPDHYKTVLNSEFIERLTTANMEGLSVPCKRKLLNINGSAKWTKGYSGPLLNENHEVRRLPLLRSKEKQVLVTSVIDTLTNILPSSSFLKTNVDSGMGFLLDGECLVDDKMTPLPFVDKKTGEAVSTNSLKKGTRIAIMAWDYHDFTRCQSELNGPALLYMKLASSSGYKVLSVPFTEFNEKDKLTVRVQYLVKQLRFLVQPG